MSTGAQGAAGGVQSATRPDAGDIAIIDAGNGAVMQPKTFDLSGSTLTFTPTTGAATAYRYALTSGSYDPSLPSGTHVTLGDDDSTLLNLGFTFPFFGKQYNQVYLNSDGNLTFGAADHESTERSLGRMNAGPPRIAPLFDDLDPTGFNAVVSVASTPSVLVVSWVQVPEWQETGSRNPQTFQVLLYPDGRIVFAWQAASAAQAVVGIGPGGMQGDTSVVDYHTASDTYAALVADIFTNATGLDLVTITQRFYANHEDAYDYLVVFNGLGIPDGPSSYASERTVRNTVTGNGDTQLDIGDEWGSQSRLQSVINMAYPSQYPDNLLLVAMRYTDTSVGILAHEMGHRWLAFITNPEPGVPNAQTLLGGGLAHWSFNFNSLASLLEGNTIDDHNDGTFRTIDATHRYSPLDQYLMGLRPAWDVPPLHDLFRVANATTLSGSGIPNTRLPQIGVDMKGLRTNVAIEGIITANGRRTPDYTVSQKHYRAGFIYVVPTGEQPNQADLDKINNFRALIGPYFNQAADGRAWVETTLNRAVHLSTFPGAGVVAGSTAAAAITLESAPQSDLRIDLTDTAHMIAIPAQVTIPAGQTHVSFTFQGLQPGVDELIATPDSGAYETVHSNVQVLASAAGLRLQPVSGNMQWAIPGGTLPQQVVLRVADQNNLPYPGYHVTATVGGGGTIFPASATSDESGCVRFTWTTGAGPYNEVRASIDGIAGAATSVFAWNPPEFTAAGLVNAASWVADVAPDGLASLFGVNLAIGESWAPSLPLATNLLGTSVLVNGTAVPLIYVSPLQINFYVPMSLEPGPATIVVQTPLGNTPPVQVNSVSAFAPGIFDDPAAGVGAILVSGQGEKTNVRPAHPDEYVEIYCTGLGSVGQTYNTAPVTVNIGGRVISDVPFAGHSNQYVGVYQVNARIPADFAPGRYPVYLDVGGKRSNTVYIEVR